MSRTLAIFLTSAGFVLLAFNITDLTEPADLKGTWLRIASNLCIIAVGIFSVLNSKKKKNEN